MRQFDLLIAGCLLFSVCLAGNAAPEKVTPIVHAHAHNDYEHKRPLLDALDNGFCSVEADIFLMDGKLPVAHNRNQIRPERTLQSLYLDPLKQRIAANGGRVYPGGPSVVLLIDVKTEAEPTYAALRDVLNAYAPMLTVWHNGHRQEGAITVIMTGNRSRRMIDADEPRYAACDGEVADLDTNPSAELVPWISADWSDHFKWRGRSGPMPDAERQKLRQIVARAHEQHRQVRLWGSPDFPDFWKELRDDGVDLINTDDLPGCREFLLKRGEEKTNGL